MRLMEISNYVQTERGLRGAWSGRIKSTVARTLTPSVHIIMADRAGAQSLRVLMDVHKMRADGNYQDPMDGVCAHIFATSK